MSQSCFKVPEDIRLKLTYYFTMKIPNKRKFQEIAWNHSSDTEFKDLKKHYKDTKKLFPFLVNDTTLPSDIH